MAGSLYIYIFFFFFCSLSTFFISNIRGKFFLSNVENVLSNSMSESKPWDGLVFVSKVNFVKVLNCIHLILWREIFPHSCVWSNSLSSIRDLYKTVSIF